jgi:SAM-dependent methyltransferase
VLRAGHGADATVRAAVGYFDWHEQPGYYRDVTRHFDRDDRLLDIGCGTGWLADHFRDYTGIDGSPDAVAAAASRGRNVIEGDLGEPLPFADAAFDATVLKDVLEHVGDPGALLDEVRRVLRPGGRVFASSPDAQRWVWDDYTHRRPFTRNAYRLLFADHGFSVVHVGYESVTPGVGLISARTRRKRRPRAFALLAQLPIHRRNVWLLARSPGVSGAATPAPREPGVPSSPS